MHYAISYVSTLDPGITTTEIQQVLQTTQKNNIAKGITGILLFSRGNFFQVLEGEKIAVSELFERIKQDDRHYNLIPIFKKEIDKPEFRDYQVDFVSVDSHYDRNDLDFYLRQVEKLNPSIRSSVSYLIKNFS